MSSQIESFAWENRENLRAELQIIFIDFRCFAYIGYQSAVFTLSTEDVVYFLWWENMWPFNKNYIDALH